MFVSNPKEWKKRDEKRPQKDNKEIISIRLARILLNLTGLKKNQTVLDPFCGYGTIIQEALVLGLNAVGVEKNTQKAQAAEKNAKWIQRQNKTLQRARFFNKDTARLSEFLKTTDFDGVTTEPVLGPYLYHRPTPNLAHRIIRDLIPLYETVFEQLARVSAKGTPVAIIFPVFKFPTQTMRIPETVFSKHFAPKNPLRGFATLETKHPFFYQNPKNKIGREIWVLEKK